MRTSARAALVPSTRAARAAAAPRSSADRWLLRCSASAAAPVGVGQLPALLGGRLVGTATCCTVCAESGGEGRGAPERDDSTGVVPAARAAAEATAAARARATADAIASARDADSATAAAALAAATLTAGAGGVAAAAGAVCAAGDAFLTASNGADRRRTKAGSPLAGGVADSTALAAASRAATLPALPLSGASGARWPVDIASGGRGEWTVSAISAVAFPGALGAGDGRWI